MRFLLVFTLLGLGLQGWSKPHLSRQWSRSTLEKPHFKYRYLNRMAPLLTESLVIQGNGVDGIRAYNRKTGHLVWGLNLQDGVEGGAAIDGNRLYFGSNDGFFYCADVNNGAILWKFKVNSESLTKPLVQGSFVYHVTGNNTLYAFDKTSGQSLWVKTNSAKSNMTVRGQTAPVYERGVLYLGFSDGSFSAINAQNGRELWSKRIGDDKKFNDVDATAVLTSSCILVSSYANSLYCLDKNSGSISWRHDVGGYSPVTIIDGKIFYPTVNSEIHLLDEGSGKLIKKVINIKGLASEINEVGSYIVYGETDGSIVLRKKADLSKAAEFSPGLGVYAKPTVDKANNEVYLISNDANIYRIDVKDGPDNPFKWSKKN